MKNTFYIIALSLILTACGGSDSDGSPSTSVDKDLFSLWKPTDDSGPLELTGGQFQASQGFSLFMPDGAQCNCSLTFIGDQESGRYTLNNCNYTYGTGSGSEAPNCNALDHTGLYTKTSTQLTICDDTQDCTIYN